MILLSGILGKGIKKVGNIVGANWKDKNYVRTYVIPANPDTAAQQTQRNAFKYCGECGSQIVGSVLNPFVDPFQSSMSGYNYFMKKNVAAWNGEEDGKPYNITWGKLSQVEFNAAPTYNTGNGSITMTWATANGQNGEATDEVWGAAWDFDNHIWYVKATHVDRSVGTLTYTIDTGLTATELECYIFAAQYTGTKLIRVSNSDRITAEAA